jgi:diguanylate cyclase (GGDEF)-like protein/PAS domain S-box-containing protein
VALRAHTQIVERFIGRLAAAIALLVALVFPATFGFIAYRDNVNDLAFKASVKASALSGMITTLPEVWQYSENRMNGLIAREPVPLVDERVEVFNDSAELLTSTGVELQGFALARRSPLYDGAREVGAVIVSRSATPLLLDIGLATLFGFTLGGLVQLVLRAVPLRALRRVSNDLFRSEERAEITLSAITDAVIVADQQGQITYLNTSAAQMLGRSPQMVLGAAIAEVVQLQDARSGVALEGAYALTLRQGRAAECKGLSVLIRADGRRIAVDQQSSPLFERDGALAGAVLCLHDVGQIRELIDLRSWEAAHDALTGLFNRRAFVQRITEALADAQRSGRTHVLLYMDLDRFKVVNDSCGHAAGDQLLMELSALILERLRGADVLARLGGDEFGLLLMGCDQRQGQRIAGALISAVSSYLFHCHAQAFSVGMSVGMTVIRDDSIDVGQAIGEADAACYWAKDQGSNRLHVYQPTDQELMDRRSETGWVARLHAALRQDRFVLFHQRIGALHAGAPQRAHYEILLRLCDEQDQLVLPGRFLAAAERYGLIPEIDRWVVARVFASIMAFAARNGERAPLLNINLSAASVTSPGLIEFIREQLERHRVDPAMICFEITETVALRHMQVAIEVMRGCQALGVSLALDDFGVGASSFGYLRNLPVDYLKIDGSFVRNIAQDPIDRAMVETINRIAHITGKTTIAEYAENEAVIAALRELGVDCAQGYGIDRPHPFTH